jgi:hypothetical protein
LSVTKGDVELFVIVLELIPLLGMWGCGASVFSVLQVYSSEPSKADLIPGIIGPPGSLGTGVAAGIWAALVWAWSEKHRQFDNRALSRAAIACRVWEVLAAVALPTMPFALGFADRLAAHLSH